MKPFLILLSLLSLISCSRYHHIPRATKRAQVLPRKEIVLTDNKQKTILNDKEQSNIKESHVPQPESLSLTALTQTKQGPLKTQTQVHKPITLKKTNVNIGDNERYKKLGRSLLMEILAMLMGGLMLLSESFAGALLGGIILAIAAVAFQITLIVLLIVFIIDVIKEIINKSKKTTPKTAKSKEQPSNTEDVENGEPLETPKETKKHPKEKNKNSWMFIYLLISNVLVWISTKIKIEK